MPLFLPERLRRQLPRDAALPLPFFFTAATARCCLPALHGRETGAPVVGGLPAARTPGHRPTPLCSIREVVLRRAAVTGEADVRIVIRARLADRTAGHAVPRSVRTPRGTAPHTAPHRHRVSGAWRIFARESRLWSSRQDPVGPVFGSQVWPRDHPMLPPGLTWFAR